MAKKGHRIQKSIQDKLHDLDEHVYILRTNMYGLQQDLAHLKVLAVELRTLVCLSSGTEGLLWRLVDELKISDKLSLHVAGSVDPNHPLAKTLHVYYIPLARAGDGDSQLTPGDYSLRDVIKQQEAIFVEGTGYSHEYVIKAVSQQIGSAHESDDIEPALAHLSQFVIKGVQPYVHIVAIDSDLVLQVAERVLDHAEAKSIYRRKPRSQEFGNLTLVARLGLLRYPTDHRRIFSCKSHRSEVEITCSIRPETLVFTARKRGSVLPEIHAPFPPNWPLNTDAIFALSYSSQLRQIQALTGYSQDEPPVDYNLGWLDARELVGPEADSERNGVVYLHSFASFRSHLKSTEFPDMEKLLLKERQGN